MVWIRILVANQIDDYKILKEIIILRNITWIPKSWQKMLTNYKELHKQKIKNAVIEALAKELGLKKLDKKV